MNERIMDEAVRLRDELHNAIEHYDPDMPINYELRQLLQSRVIEHHIDELRFNNFKGDTEALVASAKEIEKLFK